MILVKYKKPKDKKDSVPIKKAPLLEKYEQIKNLPSPHFSDCSSVDEDESDKDISDSKDREEQAETGLEFDSDESDSDKSSNDEDEEDTQSDAEDD